MIGILKFKLPEERDEFEVAQKAADYKIALFELDQWLRSRIKYHDLSTEHQDILQSVRDELHRITVDSGLDV